MILQIYASNGKHLKCIDTVNGNLEAVISDLLNRFWEEGTDGHPSLLVTDERGKLLASLTMVEAIGPACGVVEIYRVDDVRGIERLRIEYKLDSEGSYDRTEIMPM